MDRPFDADELDGLEADIDTWLAELAEAHEHIVAVDRGEGDVTRWHVRMAGEEKDHSTVWLTLGQRTLRHETYVMPAPEENDTELYLSLLRRNERIVGGHFSLGDEDAVYLRGDLPNDAVDRDAIDRILGTVYAVVEQSFGTLIRIGFASRFD